MAMYKHYIPTQRIAILRVEMRNIQAFTEFLLEEKCLLNLEDLSCGRVSPARGNACILLS